MVSDLILGTDLAMIVYEISIPLMSLGPGGYSKRIASQKIQGHFSGIGCILKDDITDHEGMVIIRDPFTTSWKNGFQINHSYMWIDLSWNTFLDTKFIRQNTHLVSSGPSPEAAVIVTPVVQT